jgi:ABC-type multidrug transport system fused ATPase/permease subunit
MVSLFRIESLVAGSITIDGVDIATVRLNTLRSKLGIIPQEPLIFSTTVRFNLDPFSQYSDLDVWGVLDCVNMKETVAALPGKLEERVLSGGDLKR